MAVSARAIQEELAQNSDPKIAEHALGFFKTGPGEYGEGDTFRGLRVPMLRALAKRHRDLPGRTVRTLLKSKFHEDRMVALLIWVHQFERGTASEKRAIYEAYLDSTDRINGWDLVDCSAHKIVGPYLEDKPRTVLHRLSRSTSVWARRIAMMATFHFIRGDDFDDTLKLAKRYLKDEHDLIHKASGWMLREVGKREPAVLTTFLDTHAMRMPRTMLRYAIEKLGPKQRKHYLSLS